MRLLLPAMAMLGGVSAITSAALVHPTGQLLREWREDPAAGNTRDHLRFG